MNVAEAWVFMWGLAYIACGFVKPDIFGNLSPVRSRVLNFVAGVSSLLGLILRDTTVGATLLMLMGVFEVVGGVASWTGATKWNVPFEDKALFNISMALMDFVSALTMFVVAHGGF